jgi:hypothetical protein
MSAQPNGEWTCLEVMGHRRHVGLMEEVTVCGISMLAIHVPTVEDDSVTSFTTYTYAPASVYGFHRVSEANGLLANSRTGRTRLLLGHQVPAAEHSFQPVEDFDDIDDERPF